MNIARAGGLVTAARKAQTRGHYGRFSFKAENQSQNGNPEILAGYRGMGFGNGADVYHTNDSIRVTGEVEIKQYGRATFVGRMTYVEMKAGASFPDVRWKGHELVHYRGIGVT